MNFVLYCCVLFALLKSSVQQEWTYESDLASGPAHWSTHFPACGGDNQSPVDIVRSATVPFNPPHFVFGNYDREDTYTVKNNGQSVQVSMNAKDITLSGGGLNGSYVLEQLNFHWGEDLSEGSEHLIESIGRPLEIQFVHYSDRYPDVINAVASGDRQALAVVAVFAEESIVQPVSPELELIADSVANIPFKDYVATLSPLSVGGLLPRSVSGEEFYRYGGSLTTPSCAEVVVWTVFKQGVYIRPDKLAKFRQLRSSAASEPEEPLLYNYRPPQPLNGRVVLVGRNVS